VLCQFSTELGRPTGHLFMKLRGRGNETTNSSRSFPQRQGVVVGLFLIRSALLRGFCDVNLSVVYIYIFMFMHKFAV
jgi:hypothetical protein